MHDRCVTQHNKIQIRVIESRWKLTPSRKIPMLTDYPRLINCAIKVNKVPKFEGYIGCELGKLDHGLVIQPSSFVCVFKVCFAFNRIMKPERYRSVEESKHKCDTLFLCLCKYLPVSLYTALISSFIQLAQSIFRDINIIDYPILVRARAANSLSG